MKNISCKKTKGHRSDFYQSTLCLESSSLQHTIYSIDKDYVKTQWRTTHETISQLYFKYDF